MFKHSDITYLRFSSYASWNKSCRLVPDQRRWIINTQWTKTSRTETFHSHINNSMPLTSKHNKVQVTILLMNIPSFTDKSCCDIYMHISISRLLWTSGPISKSSSWSLSFRGKVQSGCSKAVPLSWRNPAMRCIWTRKSSWSAPRTVHSEVLL